MLTAGNDGSTEQCSEEIPVQHGHKSQVSHGQTVSNNNYLLSGGNKLIEWEVVGSVPRYILLQGVYI